MCSFKCTKQNSRISQSFGVIYLISKINIARLLHILLFHYHLLDLFYILYLFLLYTYTRTKLLVTERRRRQRQRRRLGTGKAFFRAITRLLVLDGALPSLNMYIGKCIGLGAPPID